MTDDIVTPILRTIQETLAALNRKVTAQGHDLSDVKQDVRMIRSTIEDMGETRVTEGANAGLAALSVARHDPGEGPGI